MGKCFAGRNTRDQSAETKHREQPLHTFLFTPTESFAQQRAQGLLCPNRNRLKTDSIDSGSSIPPKAEVKPPAKGVKFVSERRATARTLLPPVTFDLRLHKSRSRKSTFPCRISNPAANLQ